MEVIYRAHDGQEFDSEKECLEYELQSMRSINILKTEMEIWDRQGNKIQLVPKSYEDLECDIDDTWYIRFNSEKAIEAFFGLSHKISIPDIQHNVGKIIVGNKYYYDDAYGMWKDATKELEELNKIMKVFEGS